MPKKAFLVVKKWNKELWHYCNPKSFIFTHLMNLNKTLRSRKSQRQRRKARGGRKKRKAQKGSRKERRQNRERMKKRLDFFSTLPKEQYKSQKFFWKGQKLSISSKLYPPDNMQAKIIAEENNLLNVIRIRNKAWELGWFCWLQYH